MRIKLGAKDLRKHEVTAVTVADVLESMGFEVDRHDKVTPSLTTEIAQGDRVVVKDIRIATKKVKREVVDAPVVEREDPTMYEGDEEVVRSGKDGVRQVTYRLRFVNGRLVARNVVDAAVRVKAVPTIVAVGTKEQPEVSPATSPAAAPSGTPWRSASPAATGPSTPATATTAASSSTSAPGVRTAARATRTRPPARPRSPSPPGSATPPAATAPGPAARPSSACRADLTTRCNAGLVLVPTPMHQGGYSR